MGKKKTTSAQRPRAPTVKAVREAGFECEDLAAGGRRLGVADLAKLLKARPTLAKAWDRGRLLRRVREVARETHWVAAAVDKHLGLAKGEFVRLLARDRVVRELWEDNREALRVSLGRALIQRAEAADPKALAAVEHLFREGAAVVRDVDFQHLTPVQMQTATGIAHQQLLRWHKSDGLPRNVDGTYTVSEFVAWLRKWERDKVTGGAEAQGMNPMQAEKARMYKLQADEAEGRLVSREVVVGMLCARAARMVQMFNVHQAEQWSEEHAGQTAGQLLEAYQQAFHRVRMIWAQWPEEVPMPDAARTKIEEALTLLLEENGNGPI